MIRKGLMLIQYYGAYAFRKGLCPIVLSVFILSCASLQSRNISEPLVINGIPFFPQEEYQCGPASLAGVLNFYGVKISPDKIAADIYSKSAKGALTIDLLIYARKIGFDAEYYHGSVDDLKARILSGNPLIVMVDYGVLFYQQNHFMVVKGYSDEGVIVNSEKTENKFIEWDGFLKTWEKTGYWTLWIKKE